MMNKKISIVVPVYNAKQTIRRCVESIINQSYSKLQIILVNDGSTDESLEICYEYQQLDNRIEVYTHENHGVSYTRNRGIDSVNGEYMMFVDSDDYVKNDMVENYVKAIEKHPADIIIGGIIFKSNGTSYEKYPISLGLMDRKKLWQSMCQEDNSIWGYVPNKMYRSDIIQKNTIRFDANVTAQEDLKFALSAFEVSNQFYSFDYCGYIYECPFVRRCVTPEVLIGNQLTILQNAIYNEVNRANYQDIVKKIHKQIYTCLYYCNSETEIKSIMMIPGLLNRIDYHSNRLGEQRMILKWFSNCKTSRICRYFSFRRKLRKLLKRA